MPEQTTSATTGEMSALSINAPDDRANVWAYSAPTGPESHAIRRFGRGVTSRQARISESFYADAAPEGDTTRHRFPDVSFGHNLQQSFEVKKFHSTQSRRLPYWTWYIIARFLGVRLSPGDRPVFGTLMHMLTLVFVIAYIVTFTWFIVYDIMSKDTRQTVLTGLVAIMIAIYWSALGIYANKLAAKLFSSQKFVESVRLHTRTIFKISAAGLMILLATTSTVLNNYSAAIKYNATTCHNVTVSENVCYVLFATRLGYSVFSLIWNLLVGIVLLSVCRTHTIGIRRFIKQLEEDGKTYELYMRNLYNGGVQNTTVQSDLTQLTDDDMYDWDDESPLMEDYGVITSRQQSPGESPSRKSVSNSCHGNQASGGQAATLVTSCGAGDCDEMDTVAGPGPSVGLQQFPPLAHSAVATEVLVNVDLESGPERPPLPSRESVLPPGKSLMNPGGQTAASGASVLPPLGESPCHVIAHSSPMLPRPVAAKTTANRPENINPPIIIVKESSVVTSGENDDSCDLADQSEVPRPGREGSLGPLEQEGVGSGVARLLINPDPPSYASRSTQQSLHVELHSPRRVSSTVTDRSSSVDNLSISPTMLSLDNILLCYWRIASRLRSTSIALQRWLMAWVVFILIWSVTFIVGWVEHEATLLEIAAFILPILLLPLVCSAYGEVNMEGKRMVQSVCPTEERVQMLLFLENQPLELTAFGFPINYSTIVKTIGALVLALSTKILLEEFSIFK